MPTSGILGGITHTGQASSVVQGSSGITSSMIGQGIGSGQAIQQAIISQQNAYNQTQQQANSSTYGQILPQYSPFSYQQSQSISYSSVETFFTVNTYLLFKGYSEKERLTYLAGYLHAQGITSNKENYIASFLKKFEELLKVDYETSFNKNINKELLDE